MKNIYVYRELHCFHHMDVSNTLFLTAPCALIFRVSAHGDLICFRHVNMLISLHLVYRCNSLIGFHLPQQG